MNSLYLGVCVAAFDVTAYAELRMAFSVPSAVFSVVGFSQIDRHVHGRREIIIRICTANRKTQSSIPEHIYSRLLHCSSWEAIHSNYPILSSDCR
jgi:hypothetical protein